MPFDNLPRQVTIREVGPRDGLQNESGFVTTQDKVRMIDGCRIQAYAVLR